MALSLVVLTGLVGAGSGHVGGTSNKSSGSLDVDGLGQIGRGVRVVLTVTSGDGRWRRGASGGLVIGFWYAVGFWSNHRYFVLAVPLVGWLVVVVPGAWRLRTVGSWCACSWGVVDCNCIVDASILFLVIL